MSEWSEGAVHRLAETLSEAKVAGVSPARPGGNNRVFRIETEAGERRALKIYPRQDDDPRDRLGQEWSALVLLDQGGIARVARPLARAPSVPAALYTWIEGEPPGPMRHDDLGRFANFLIDLQRLSPRAESIAKASAACFSAAEARDQLADRRQGLAASPSADLQAFLTQEFHALTAALDDRLARASPRAKAEVTREQAILSPSDFGLHNALRAPDGGLCFLDFEYFGWDDPVKAVADILLHPGNELAPAWGEIFRRRIEPFFADRDAAYGERFRLLFPLYGAIWCLILLNEYRADRWQRRVLAGGRQERLAIQDRQLDRARHLCRWTREWIDAAG